MKKKSIILQAGLLALVMAAFAGQNGAFAETAGTAHNAQADQKIAELRKLKETNPEEFKRIIDQRKNELNEKLEKLKSENPEKYEQVTKMMRENQVQRLKRMRQENPEEFKKIVENSREKLIEMKKNNPEQYEAFMKSHPKANQAAERAAEKASKPAKKSWWGFGSK